MPGWDFDSVRSARRIVGKGLGKFKCPAAPKPSAIFYSALYRFPLHAHDSPVKMSGGRPAEPHYEDFTPSGIRFAPFIPVDPDRTGRQRNISVRFWTPTGTPAGSPTRALAGPTA